MYHSEQLNTVQRLDIKQREANIEIAKQQAELFKAQVQLALAQAKAIVTDK